MTTLEVDPQRLREIAAEEYNRRIAVIDALSDPDAVDWLLSHVKLKQDQAQESNSNGVGSKPARKRRTRKQVTVPEAVGKLILTMTGDFTRADLTDKMAGEYPSLVSKATASYLRVVLGGLVEAGQLEIAQPGGGKQKTVYRRKGESK